MNSDTSIPASDATPATATTDTLGPLSTADTVRHALNGRKPNAYEESQQLFRAWHSAATSRGLGPLECTGILLDTLHRTSDDIRTHTATRIARHGGPWPRHERAQDVQLASFFKRAKETGQLMSDPEASEQFTTGATELLRETCEIDCVPSEFKWNWILRDKDLSTINDRRWFAQASVENCRRHFSELNDNAFMGAEEISAKPLCGPGRDVPMLADQMSHDLTSNARSSFSEREEAREALVPILEPFAKSSLEQTTVPDVVTELMQGYVAGNTLLNSIGQELIG